MKRVYLFVLLFTCAFAFAKAQEIKALGIGDVLPDLAIGKTVPEANAGIKTSDYKDKLLIIDLWATNCSSCITEMPKFDSLQRVFGEKIRILPVTPEAEGLVSAFWKRNRYTRNLKLSTVVEDRVLHAYFPHKVISHDVWVYKGKIVAITLPDNVTAENIQKVLDGQLVNLPFKNDFARGFNGAVQSLKDTTEMNDAQLSSAKLVKYASVSKYNTSVKAGGSIFNENRGGIVRDSITRSVRAYIINQPVYLSYLWALLNAKGMDNMQVMMTIASVGFERTRNIWEVTDRSRYIREKSDLTREQWMKNNAICYESLNPDTGQTDHDVYAQIAKDLNDLLGLEVRLEKRKVKTLVLTKIGQTDLLKTKNSGIDPSYNAYQEGSFFRMRDRGLDALVYTFNQYYGNPFAIDETKYTGRVDMDLNIPDWTDIPNIKKELTKYGLGLKEELREVEMLVFTETGGGYKQPSK